MVARVATSALDIIGEEGRSAKASIGAKDWLSFERALEAPANKIEIRKIHELDVWATLGRVIPITDAESDAWRLCSTVSSSTTSESKSGKRRQTDSDNTRFASINWKLTEEKAQDS